MGEVGPVARGNASRNQERGGVQGAVMRRIDGEGRGRMGMEGEAGEGGEQRGRWKNRKLKLTDLEALGRGGRSSGAEVMLSPTATPRS